MSEILTYPLHRQVSFVPQGRALVPVAAWGDSLHHPYHDREDFCSGIYPGSGRVTVSDFVYRCSTYRSFYHAHGTHLGHESLLVTVISKADNHPFVSFRWQSHHKVHLDRYLIFRLLRDFLFGSQVTSTSSHVRNVSCCRYY